MTKSLKNSRAARAMKVPNNEPKQDLTLDYEKSEDPAKMTYSIPDFLSRNEVNLPIYFQYLESCSPITNMNINT